MPGVTEAYQFIVKMFAWIGILVLCLILWLIYYV